MMAVKLIIFPILLSFSLISISAAFDTCLGRNYNRKTGFCTQTGVFSCYPKNSVRCENGDCVSKWWKCDGQNDCRDGTDEINCKLCSESKDHFTCKNGNCLHKSGVCDHVNQCGDGSDETGCPTGNSRQGACGVIGYRCTNDRCVNMTLVCDGRNDCGDNSDEQDCEGLDAIRCFSCESCQETSISGVSVVGCNDSCFISKETKEHQTILKRGCSKKSTCKEAKSSEDSKTNSCCSTNLCNDVLNSSARSLGSEGFFAHLSVFVVLYVWYNRLHFED